MLWFVVRCETCKTVLLRKLSMKERVEIIPFESFIGSWMNGSRGVHYHLGLAPRMYVHTSIAWFHLGRVWYRIKKEFSLHYALCFPTLVVVILCV